MTAFRPTALLLQGGKSSVIGGTIAKFVQAQGDKNYVAPMVQALPDRGRNCKAPDIGTGDYTPYIPLH